MSGKPGMKSKKLARIPIGYRQAKKQKRDIDRRTRDGRWLREEYQRLCTDLGGEDELSVQQRALAEEFTWQRGRLRKLKQQALETGSFNDLSYSACLNSLLGLARTLGIERKAKRVMGLHELLRAEAEDAAP